MNPAKCLLCDIGLHYAFKQLEEPDTLDLKINPSGITTSSFDNGGEMIFAFGYGSKYDQIDNIHFRAYICDDCFKEKLDKNKIDTFAIRSAHIQVPLDLKNDIDKQLRSLRKRDHDKALEILERGSFGVDLLDPVMKWSLCDIEGRFICEMETNLLSEAERMQEEGWRGDYEIPAIGSKIEIPSHVKHFNIGNSVEVVATDYGNSRIFVK